MLRKNLPQYVKREKSHYYFRRRNWPRVKLTGVPWTPEFMAQIHAILINQRPTPSAHPPGSVAAILTQYLASLDFTSGKRASTQDGDRRRLEAWGVTYGAAEIRFLQVKHIEDMLASKAGVRHAQRSLHRVLRASLDYCVNRKYIRENPARLIKLEAPETVGYHPITNEEIAQFEARFPIGTKARLAFALCLYTGSRRSDAHRLGPQHVQNGRIQLIQQKTGSVIDIPLVEPLRKIIAATNLRGIDTFLVTDQGRPYTVQGFANYLKDCFRQAGLPHCSSHGLRKALIRQLAEAGYSEDDIASVSGHTDMREIRTYVQNARKAKMADRALGGLFAATAS